MPDISSYTQAARDREAFLTSVYKEAFPLVAAYISKSGGTFEQAKDIFHDAIVVYYEKVVVGTVTIEKSRKAYLLGIARHLWSRQCNDQRKLTTIDEYDNELMTSENITLVSDKLVFLLKKAGEKCMNILRAFYYDKYSMQEIAQDYGYGSIRSVTVQKYKCLEKLREQVKEKSLVYEDFLK